MIRTVSHAAQGYPIPAETEREFLGNGEWPYPPAPHTSTQYSIPPPPTVSNGVRKLRASTCLSGCNRNRTGSVLSWNCVSLLCFQEGVDNAPKVAYPMKSRPRGVGLIINNKNFTCGMKVGGATLVESTDPSVAMGLCSPPLLPSSLTPSHPPPLLPSLLTQDRVGTDRDAEALMKLFIYLGFYTNRYDNLKGRDMHRRLQVRTLQGRHLPLP